MDGLKTSGTRDRGKGRDWVVGLKSTEVECIAYGLIVVAKRGEAWWMV